jgi:drug/metabolite transporter (DMT)-like permease
MIFASLLVAPFFTRRITNQIGIIHRKEWLIIFTAGICLALHFGLWISSLAHTTVASSVVLVTSHPVFVALLSYIIFKEKMNSKTLAGIFITFTGVIVINLETLDFSSGGLYGNMLALAASLAMGLYLVCGRSVTNRINTLNYLFIVYCVSAGLLLAASLVSGAELFGYSGKTYTMLLLLALVPQVIGHSSLNFALKAMPATVVSTAILGEPLGAGLLAWAILDEAPGMYEILGGIIIIAGILVVMRRGYWLAV